MPVYEYVCTTCRNRFDKLRPMTSMDDEAPCPDCGSRTSRALSVFASFRMGDGGEMEALSGMGGCACAAGGACGCSAMGR